ncbi:hypothetical protein RvY_18082-1 [Ramazzottius varieornatus]|uniref:Uncharacterized protein n=1 Tax=Ramazzottius varieornatus TaxID=947166 RepID=A0A1D1W4K7_RAMVA|nr:hypothetical protein RvY_18082-1 [Ramazzottius varieornatus]
MKIAFIQILRRYRLDQCEKRGKVGHSINWRIDLIRVSSIITIWCKSMTCPFSTGHIKIFSRVCFWSSFGLLLHVMCCPPTFLFSRQQEFCLCADHGRRKLGLKSEGMLFRCFFNCFSPDTGLVNFEADLVML